ncbi:uncharacterized protein LOC106140904 isoform X1 [Amyelois transitella]|uniref:uncharacterized protein LOC106140904 isoform X1 n=1 Tax=Amyelois transitella TaxID=680683 RepID=UPI00067AD473|nr:uncharacterized protein LOC106140904 isoform X1 [Amyelois transitella]
MPRTLLSICILVATLCIIDCQAMIMRNNALMSKMVSHFQDNHVGEPPPKHKEDKPRPEKVMTIMQSVLCKNFPSIPCQVIIEDETLRILIEKSIQQIQYKRLQLEKTTARPGYTLTLFPIVNSEDLSNFLQVRESQYYGKDKKKEVRKRKPKKSFATGHWSKEETSKHSKKQKNDAKKKNVYSGRKMRKFYPHKVKYKDKVDTHPVMESDEKMSLSVEVPDTAAVKKRHRLEYKAEPEDAVWRIDYMKHGEPSLNKLPYGSDNLNAKFSKTGPNVIVDDGLIEQGPRKDVLHPDVYIKKNFIRKNVDNSEGTD